MTDLYCKDGNRIDWGCDDDYSWAETYDEKYRVLTHDDSDGYSCVKTYSNGKLASEIEIRRVIICGFTFNMRTVIRHNKD